MFGRPSSSFLPADVVKLLQQTQKGVRGLRQSLRWFASLGRIDDQTWFELQFNPEETRAKYHIPMPDLPPDEVQLGFTARTGRVNLQQAFDFYQYVVSKCELRTKRQPRILDFGGGWGRISRFFLRDTWYLRQEAINSSSNSKNSIDARTRCT
jgi:hypothetical protein